MSDYADYLIVSDSLAGHSERTSGVGHIQVQGRAGRYAITYEFGRSGYLLWGSGSLVGKTVNIRFDNSEPASLKCLSGSGHCRVLSSRKL